MNFINIKVTYPLFAQPIQEFCVNKGETETVYEKRLDVSFDGECLIIESPEAVLLNADEAGMILLSSKPGLNLVGIMDGELGLWFAIDVI